jgi:tetratricopeptide (TPR) repeat protein
VLHPLVRSFAAAQLVEQAEFEKAARGRWVEWYTELAEGFGHCWEEVYRLNELDDEISNIRAVIFWTISQGKYQETLLIGKSASITFYYEIRGLLQDRLEVNIVFYEAACKLNDTELAICFLDQIIHTLLWRGELPEASDYIRLLELKIQWNTVSDDTKAVYYRAKGGYFLFCKEPHKAVHEISNVMRLQIRTTTYTYLSCLGWYAICLYHTGKNREAQDILLCILQSQAYSMLEIAVLKWLGKIYVNEEDLENAEVILDQALTKSRQVKWLRDISLVQYDYARLHTLRCNLPAAHASLLEAIDLFERMGMRRELAEAREELARLKAQMAEAAE